MQVHAEACCSGSSHLDARRVSFELVSLRTLLNVQIQLRGGIRGIVELEALRQIERVLGGRLNVLSFFDLIVGTRYGSLFFPCSFCFCYFVYQMSLSTGGIIALGLGAKEWSVEECTGYFESLCKEAFTRRAGGNIPGVSWFVDNYNHSKYKTQPLRAALMGAFSEEAYLFGGPRSSRSHTSHIKVAVTTTSNAGSPVILANYNRFSGEKRTLSSTFSYFQVPLTADYC